METEALIQAVEKRRFLYDKEDNNYSNRNFINAEWKKVANEVGCSENDAKKRWKQLRDYFLKALREPPKSGSAGGVKRKWYLFDRMLFIKPYTYDRKTTSNMEPLSPDDHTADDDVASQVSASSFSLDTSRSLASTPINLSIEETEAVHVPEVQNEVQNSDEPPREQLRTNVGKRPKRSFPQQRRSQGAFESEMLEAAKRLGQKKEISEEEHFFKNLVPKLQQMSPLDRMECQAEIHMIVLKYMKKASSSSLCTTRHSDNDVEIRSHPSTSTAISFNDLQPYQYSHGPVTETSNSMSNYESMSHYRQYPDY